MDDIIKDGAKEVFRKIVAAGKISDLPESYRNVFTSVHKQIIPKIFEELRDPKKMAKATNVYNLTPKRYSLFLIERKTTEDHLGNDKSTQNDGITAVTVPC